MVGANMHMGQQQQQPSHMAPHQNTPPHSAAAAQQQVSMHPSPSPGMQQHQGGPVSVHPQSSGTPQPTAYMYQQAPPPPPNMVNNGGGAQQQQQNPPLQPSPHTPTSPQSLYPGGGYGMPQYGAHVQQPYSQASQFAAHGQPHHTSVSQALVACHA